MATKTKKEKVVDLKPKAEKITDEQLTNIQNVVNTLNRSQLELGIMETRKHGLLHNIATIQDKLTLMQSEFEKDYGTTDINIQTGEINYPPNVETNKED
jgi:hypothetical protein|tara:strand:- start:191 stop:487 length:297 start_codon:yes stop_codon:yes gene_type:complete